MTTLPPTLSPALSPALSPTLSPTLSPGAPYLVWLAGVSWTGIRGTDRNLVMAMSRHARVLWVDMPISPLVPAARRGSPGRQLRPRLSVVDDRVTRLTPVAPPGRTRPGLRSATAPLLRAQVRWALDRLAVRPSAVVATHLEDVLGRWGSDVVSVLYGTDDYVAGAQLLGLAAGRLRKLERMALDRADVVAVVSQHLADRWSGLGASPVFIPNGCCVGPAPAGGQPWPPGARDLPRPVVGVVGQLSERIDMDLLESIADAGLSLLLVGPHDRRWESQRFAALVARPRVHYAGPVPAEAVPAYLAAIDIGITPYRDSAFNRASFPLKTLEYLAAGRPVVATDLPAARWLLADFRRPGRPAGADDVLTVASGHAEFVAAIRRMAGGEVAGRGLAGDRGPAAHTTPADRCRALADLHSWSRRAASFAEAIGLPAPGPAGDPAEVTGSRR